MRTVFFATVSAVLLSAGTAIALPYGAAGCGLGALLIGSEPGMMQLFAATTNGSSANQTFGITSGTLGCGASVTGKPSAKAFIETNREALAKDMARGSGEAIVQLSAIAGCKDSSQVASTLQKQFKTVFPSANVSTQHVTTSLLSTLSSNKTLMCTST